MAMALSAMFMMKSFFTFMAGSVDTCGVHVHKSFEELDFVQDFKACTAAANDGNDVVVHRVKLKCLTEGFCLGK